MERKPDYHIVSFSGGKDSTAMLLRMLELGMPVDEILFCDTTVEFPQMYEHIKQVEEYIKRPITIIKAEHDYEYYLLEKPVKKKNGTMQKGYSFPGPRCRWCTRHLKVDVIQKHERALKENYNIIEYVGIAADEQKRKKDKNYPLIEWRWTERMCLNYCRSKGFSWGGLYKHFHRVSCWCCPLQSFDGMRKLRRYYPDLWNKLIDWQHKTDRTFKPDYSMDDIEIRFAAEEELKSWGIDINPRKKIFQDEIKRRLQR